MNILLIDPYGALVDFGMRCIHAGHAVKQWIKPWKGEPSKIARGLIPRVSNWQEMMSWADLVVLSDNAYEMKELEKFNDKGFPIFGTNMNGARLELDRQYGMDVIKSGGIKVMPSTEFSNYNDAIKFVAANPRRFVSKPSGDADKALSYVSSSAADMTFMLNHWKEKGSAKMDFILQEFVPGIEVAVGGWVGANGFSKNVCENFEHKKLMPSNYGCNCYSPDTEVLTDSGWKFWPAVTQDDKVCTLIDGRIEFEKPSQLTIGNVSDYIVGWSGQYSDLLVTYYHRMYVENDNGDGYGFISAIEASKRNANKFMRVGGQWSGNDEKLLEIGSDAASVSYLFGVFSKKGMMNEGKATLSGLKPDAVIAVQHHADKCGLHVSLHCEDFVNTLVIDGDAFSQVCEDICKDNAGRRRIPSFIRNATQEAMQAFLDGFNCNGETTLNTISHLMTGDFQEMLLKLGKPSTISGKSILFVDGDDVFTTKEHQITLDTFKEYYLYRDNCYFKKYEGQVYCCTVTSGVIYVRRNGKPCWMGQTGEQGTVLKYAKESKLFNDTLAKFEDYLVMSGHRGYVDLAFIIDENGEPRPLEWTTRPGWPLFNIQSSLHKGDPAQWMLDLLDGKDTLKVKNDVCTGVVIPIGDYPKTKTTGRDHSGYPIYGLGENPNLHLCEVMLGKAPHMVDGEVKEVPCLVTAGDYVAVACGLGDTVKEACEKAYELVKEIDIPESINVRDDIGERCEADIPLLQEHGLMTDWKYE